MIGLYTLGRRAVVFGADDFTPKQRAGSPEMTPQQLVDLDRKLSPAEYARVSRFQVDVANALQKKEEATPYVDPKTGERRVAVVDYIPGDGASAPRTPRPSDSAPAPIWKKVAFAALVGIVAGAAILLGRSR